MDDQTILKLFADRDERAIAADAAVIRSPSAY